MNLLHYALYTFFSFALVVNADNYSGDLNIYELTPSNFDKVVHKSNYTTIVKFYAPWCGYCKQLEPIYHRLGKFLHLDGKYGVNVASVNCDKQSNKPICQKYHVQGFPTLMVFRPPKYQRGQTTKGRHVPEPYNGERSLKPMVDFITSRIKNYVKKIHNIHSDSLPEWLSEDDTTNKVLLLTTSNDITPLFKTMAIDFLGSISFGMISLKSIDEKISVEINGEPTELPVEPSDSLPILLIYKPETKTFVRYTGGKLKKKNKLEQWIIDETGVNPSEGALSKKDKKYYAKFRGERVRAKDEL